jgi:hypothetical protein
MEAMLGISLYTYPYLNQEKRFVFSSTKLEIRAEQVLPGREWSGVGGGEWGWGRGEK